MTDAEVAGWWFGDVIATLRASGCVVEPYCAGNLWHAVITWDEQ